MNRILLSTLIACLFLTTSASAQQAMIDERLLGTWENAYEEGAPDTKSTLTLKADGTALMIERNEGKEQADVETWGWETSENTIRFSGVKFLGRDDAEFSFEYRIEGDRLIIRQLKDDNGSESDELILVRVKLAGRWAMRGTGVGYTGGEGDVFVLTLGTDGNAVIEITSGCMIVSEPAVWEADERELRLFPVKKPAEREGGYLYPVDGKSYKVNSWPDRETIYEYFLHGDELTLRLIRSNGNSDVTADKEMVLTRKAGF